VNRDPSVGAERKGLVDMYAEDADKNTWKLQGSRESYSRVAKVFDAGSTWCEILKSAGALCTGRTDNELVNG